MQELIEKATLHGGHLKLRYEKSEDDYRMILTLKASLHRYGSTYSHNLKFSVGI